MQFCKNLSKQRKINETKRIQTKIVLIDSRKVPALLNLHSELENAEDKERKCVFRTIFKTKCSQSIWMYNWREYIIRCVSAPYTWTFLTLKQSNKRQSILRHTVYGESRFCIGKKLVLSDSAFVCCNNPTVFGARPFICDDIAWHFKFITVNNDIHDKIAFICLSSVANKAS